MEICHCTKNKSQETTNSKDSKCSNGQKRNSPCGARGSNKRITHTSWQCHWANVEEDIDSIKVAVPGPFNRLSFVKLQGCVSHCTCQCDDCVKNDPFKKIKWNGIPDAWLEYLSAEQYCPKLARKYLRLTDYVMNKKGLAILQGIPDPWKYVNQYCHCDSISACRIQKEKKIRQDSKISDNNIIAGSMSTMRIEEEKDESLEEEKDESLEEEKDESLEEVPCGPCKIEKLRDLSGFDQVKQNLNKLDDCLRMKEIERSQKLSEIEKFKMLMQKKRRKDLKKDEILQHYKRETNFLKCLENRSMSNHLKDKPEKRRTSSSLSKHITKSNELCRCLQSKFPLQNNLKTLEEKNVDQITVPLVKDLSTYKCNFQKRTSKPDKDFNDQKEHLRKRRSTVNKPDGFDVQKEELRKRKSTVNRSEMFDVEKKECRKQRCNVNRPKDFDVQKEELKKQKSTVRKPKILDVQKVDEILKDLPVKLTKKPQNQKFVPKVENSYNDSKAETSYNDSNTENSKTKNVKQINDDAKERSISQILNSVFEQCQPCGQSCGRTYKSPKVKMGKNRRDATVEELLIVDDYPLNPAVANPKNIRLSTESTESTGTEVTIVSSCGCRENHGKCRKLKSKSLDSLAFIENMSSEESLKQSMFDQSSVTSDRTYVLSNRSRISESVEGDSCSCSDTEDSDQTKSLKYACYCPDDTNDMIEKLTKQAHNVKETLKEINSRIKITNEALNSPEITFGNEKLKAVRCDCSSLPNDSTKKSSRNDRIRGAGETNKELKHPVNLRKIMVKEKKEKDGNEIPKQTCNEDFKLFERRTIDHINCGIPNVENNNSSYLKQSNQKNNFEKCNTTVRNEEELIIELLSDED